MYYSNRRQDVVVSQRVEYIMDSMYSMLGWESWRPHNKEWDIHGIDVILSLPGMSQKLWVDEKAATKYWNRDLNTYACELSCKTNKNGYGWFAKENNGFMMNTHLLLIWMRALEPSLRHISSLEFMVINKHDLQKYFMLATGMQETDDTLEFLEHIQWNDQKRYVVNEDLALRCSDIYPEYPVNAVFSKEILKKLAIDGGTFSRFEVRDALREARAKKQAR